MRRKERICQMIMGIGGHWVFKFYGKHDVYIGNGKRNIPFIEGSSSADAYCNAAVYLAKRINRDRLMFSYARKKGHSINSKKGRKPRITYITVDSRYLPVAVTLGRCASRRYLDGKPFRKRYKPSKCDIIKGGCGVACARAAIREKQA